MIKEKINNKGLKIKWVAKQIDVNYNSLRVYLSNENLMPEAIKKSIEALIR